MLWTAALTDNVVAYSRKGPSESHSPVYTHSFAMRRSSVFHLKVEFISPGFDLD